MNTDWDHCTVLCHGYLWFYFSDTIKMDREIKCLSDLKEGQIVRGYVKTCSDVGVFVRYLAVVLVRLVKKCNQDSVGLGGFSG